MPSPQPLNRSLWNRVKSEAKKRYSVWPSAYASGWLTKEYKKRGGKFRGKSRSKSRSSRSSSSSLRRWFAEKWVDVCKLPRKVPCGRSKSNSRGYPYCRPTRRVSSRTPKLASELTLTEIRKLCRRKRSRPESRSPIQQRRRRRKS